MKKNIHSLRLKRLGIDTYKEAVIYIRKNCHICRAEGFEAEARIQVMHQDKKVIATLNIIDSNLLESDEVSLSNYAWTLLDAQEGNEIYLSHPKQLHSLSYIRSKIYGHVLKKNEITEIVSDLMSGYLSDVHIAAFLAASAGGRLNKDEIFNLTKAMIQAGEQLKWASPLVVDKHCVGGLPGNRTSLIIVPIVTAFGLTMPKTSSRAITSPSGTADTMEALAPVELDISTMRRVVDQEKGCIVWGQTVALSPADDLLIRIERAIDLDSEGQLVASILSKKIAAGATHIIIDIPIGPTAKVRDSKTATIIKYLLETIGKSLGVDVRVIFTDGMYPIGRGIGPALEAKDVLSVLQCEKNAPQDLRDRALLLAGKVIEFSKDVMPGTGKQIATTLLDSGRAWRKFQAICQAQGGLFEPPTAPYTHTIVSKIPGKIQAIDNRRLAQVAKLAGAPKSKAAGIELLASPHTPIDKNQPIFTIHAETSGELKYALDYFEQEHDIIAMGDDVHL